MTFQAAELVITLVAAIGALIVATATVVWFMADQFKKNRAEFWKAITALHNSITEKIDDHSKDDDRRFHELQTQIWQMAVENAQQHGRRIPDRPNGN